MMNPRVGSRFAAILLTGLMAGAASATDLPIERAVLAPAPKVPPSITRQTPARVVVEVEVKEFTARLADDVEYVFWGFGGTVPGPFIRIREGDEVEFHLHNHPDNKLPHNIDLHAVTGPGGGAASSFTAPGHSSTFSFQALNPGVFVYHCATAPVGMHIANGMYGLIQVVPKEGLAPVDREYYVMQGEFYTEGRYGSEGLQSFSMEKALEENPDYVVFNGSVGSLAGDNAIRANVGETVRLYVGNGGPNLVSSFHAIGEIFDNVWVEGGVLMNRNVQTTLIPAGGAAVVEFRLDVPGTLILVDHSIFRAFNKGALGMLAVAGDIVPAIYSGKLDDTIYQPEGQVASSTPEPALPPALTKDARIARGEAVFNRTCFACHQASGLGIPGVFPPLAGSDYLKADIDRAISGVIYGQQGKLVVNGKEYNGLMTPQNLNDEEIANVVTFVLNSWGNVGEAITPDRVTRVRKEGPRGNAFQQ
ncbi:nitrite reductase, copper-containing [bacterium]|nr:nitrite reductase, copper-containing [bacterium]